MFKCCKEKFALKYTEVLHKITHPEGNSLICVFLNTACFSLVHLILKDDQKPAHVQAKFNSTWHTADHWALWKVTANERGVKSTFCRKNTKSSLFTYTHIRTHLRTQTHMHTWTSQPSKTWPNISKPVVFEEVDVDTQAHTQTYCLPKVRGWVGKERCCWWGGGDDGGDRGCGPLIECW